MNQLRTTAFIIAIALVTLLLIKCRRSDTVQHLNEKNVSAHFFQISTNDPLALSINRSLRYQESRQPFVNELIRWAGLPVWAKVSRTHMGLSPSARSLDSSTTGDFILVPFADDSLDFVKAILIIRTDGADTTYNMVYHWQYQGYLNSPSTYWVAVDLAGLFLNQDYYTFGHNKFSIQDVSLKTKLMSGLPSNFPFHTVSGCSNCLMAQTNWELYWQHWWQDVINANPPFLPPPPSTDGESGPGGGIQPNPCRNIASGNSNPCNGGTGSGWVPTSSVPCDAYISILQNDTAFISTFKSLTNADTLNRNYETGFYVIDRSNKTYIEVEGVAGSPTIAVNFAVPLDGFLHCHYTGLNSIFSANDVYLMAQIFLAGPGYRRDSTNFFFGLTSATGQPYLMKVTNAATFRAFAQKVFDTEADAKKFTSKYNPRLKSNDVAKNEKAFLKMIEEMGGVDGVTLYRGNGDCNHWTKLGLTGSSVTETNCF